MDNLREDNSCRKEETIEYTDNVLEQMNVLYAKITVNLEDYFQEKATSSDVKDRLKKYYQSIKNYCINTGITTEKNEAYKRKLLKDIYRSYRHKAVLVAVDVNDKEGKEIGISYFNEDSETPVIYYSADYYYKCEDLRGKLSHIAKEIAAEEGIMSFETESVDKRKRYVYDYEFNHVWLWKHDGKVGNEIKGNKDFIPTKDMKVLYCEEGEQEDGGKLLISYGEEWLDSGIKKSAPRDEQLKELELFIKEHFTVANNAKFQEFCISIMG
ncbi:hypothetical protein [Konateibacter massiliensis]|uniref:hypothetical protein n=1 Tax=Konateibacter massiliensis TaxID=2002841 RepID=UPI000C14D450|nr:hypothetical protein [Konateibacter massiliensis]